MNRPRVAILTVTHNDGHELDGYFEALAGLEPERCDYEVCFVDSGSRDDSVARLEAAVCPWPRTILRRDDNVGFAMGMNLAIGNASAECSQFLLLNPDARPRPDAVTRMIEARERHHRDGLRIGAVTGRLLRPEVAGEPQRLDACGMRLAPAWRHFDRGSGEIDRGQHADAVLVFGATGAASLFAREALFDVAVEGEVFDPAFHTFREDAELCFRLQERGWSVLYEPAARIVHRRFNVPERRASMPRAVNFHSLKNRYLLRLYHQTRGNLFSTFIATTWRELQIVIWVLLRERGSLAAYRWLWHHRRSIAARRRAIQQRRTVPPREVEAWFWSDQRPIPRP